MLHATAGIHILSRFAVSKLRIPSVIQNYILISQYSDEVISHRHALC